MKRAAAAGLAFLLIPYIATLAWTGRAEGMTEERMEGERTVLLDRGGRETVLGLEEYLIGVTAAQIPADYEKEALKAQAIIARTAVYRQMEDRQQIEESALDMDYLEQSQLEILLGEERALSCYKEIRDAVYGTEGQVMKWNGEYPEPLFHAVSAGKTRQGDDAHPYLAAVEEEEDRLEDGYLTVSLLSREETANRLNSMADSPGLQAENVLESLQVIEKDSAGYVESIQAGTKTYSGDEIRYALGLSSPAFQFEAYEDQVRISCMGSGHGYGLDQAGAGRKAEAGWTAQEILNYYYKNIVVVSE